MAIVVVGTNHASAPIEVRERLAFRAEQVPSILSRLREELALDEAAILSTCNRVEIYARGAQPETALLGLASFLNRHGGLGEHHLDAHLYRLAEPDSVRHLFRVAGGLDSMVLGEAEILHQVKQAYELAHRAGATGKALNTLFQKALNAGKAVRERTALGQGGVSIGSVSLELAQKIFGSLRGQVVALVGAGKIGEVTLKRLTERGAGRVTILNRSRERAEELARRYKAEADVLDALERHLVEADIVLTCAASPSALITAAQIAALMPQRRHRALCLIDLGVPRNVEPAAGLLDNVYLFDIDDLQDLVAHTHAARRRAVEQSQRIIDDKVGHFLSWWHQEHGACATASSSALAAAP